jgi:hypothetical protein
LDRLGKGPNDVGARLAFAARVDAGTMEVITLEIDDDGCGRLQFELPVDATDEEVAYIESLVPRIESGLLELRDPGTGEVVFSCRPSFTGVLLLKTATRSAVKLTH